MAGTAARAAVAAGGDEKPMSAGRIVLASLVGTMIEFYEFYIYGTAAAPRRHIGAPSRPISRDSCCSTAG